MGCGKRAGNKYGNSKIKTPGHWFDSKLEQAVFYMLTLRERAGEIRNLKHHAGGVFLSAARIELRPDFTWEIGDPMFPIQEWGEAKGLETDAYRIKRRLWKAYGPGPLYVWVGKSSAITLKETLIPEGGGE